MSVNVYYYQLFQNDVNHILWPQPQTNLNRSDCEGMLTNSWEVKGSYSGFSSNLSHFLSLCPSFNSPLISFDIKV